MYPGSSFTGTNFYAKCVSVCQMKVMALLSSLRRRKRQAAGKRVWVYDIFGSTGVSSTCRWLTINCFHICLRLIREPFGCLLTCWKAFQEQIYCKKKKRKVENMGVTTSKAMNVHKQKLKYTCLCMFLSY